MTLSFSSTTCCSPRLFACIGVTRFAPLGSGVYERDRPAIAARISLLPDVRYDMMLLKFQSDTFVAGASGRCFSRYRLRGPSITAIPVFPGCSGRADRGQILVQRSSFGGVIYACEFVSDMPPFCTWLGCYGWKERRDDEPGGHYEPVGRRSAGSRGCASVSVGGGRQRGTASAGR